MKSSHTSRPAAAAPAETAQALKLYEKLVATAAGVERKGATMPYTSVNGHMFSMLAKTGKVALRLPPDERAAFMKKYATSLHEAHGTVLEEYVEVPPALLGRTRELAPWFARSHAYVGALKPKPTTRRRATGQ